MSVQEHYPGWDASYYFMHHIIHISSYVSTRTLSWLGCLLLFHAPYHIHTLTSLVMPIQEHYPGADLSAFSHI